MIVAAFLRALGQIGDPRLARVLVKGVVLAVLLLAGASALTLWGVAALVPDHVTLPLLGQVDGLADLAGWGGALAVIALGVVLMVPVAAALAGLFLDEVVAAVEARHYPHLPPATPLPLPEALRDTLSFLALIVAVNLVALAVLPFTGPLAPLGYWAVNGWLLGREFFAMAATRRLGRAGAAALARHHPLMIWAAGVLMAAPLSLPLVGLVVPVLGAATFTHIFHALNGRGA